MKLINYTSCIKREHRVYSIFGFAVPQGVTISSMTIIFYPIISLVIGYLISIPLKVNMFNFMRLDWNGVYLFFWAVLGGGIGWFLKFFEIQHYKAGEYLKAYFKKRRSITTNPDVRKHNFVKKRVIIDTLFRSEL